MCRIILLVIVGWVVGLLAAVTLAAKFGPWWSVPLAILGYALVSALLLRWTLKTLLMLPFRLKGKVLRGATVMVHGVERSTAPVKEVKEIVGAEQAGEAPDEPAAPGVTEPAVRATASDGRDYFWVDVTIKPVADANGTFRLWEPGELLIVPVGAKVTLKDADQGEPVRDVQIWQEGVWGKDDPGKYPGTQRVRLLFGVKPEDERRVMFRYYMETFGDVTLPEGSIVQG